MDLGHSPDTGASEGELRSGYALTPSPSHSKNISLFTERRTSERAVSKDGYSSFLFNPLWGFPVVAAGILFVVDHPLIVHVGRYSRQKNHAGLVRAAARVVAREPSVRFLLVGDGPLRGEIEELIRQYKLTEHVRTLGVRRDVPRILTCSDIFFLPSRFEGFPVAALEASAAGLPIVGTNVEGLSEAVTDSVTGLLRSFGDEVGLSEALLKLLSNQELRADLGANGRNRVLARFTRQASAEKLCRIYRQIAAERDQR